MRIQYVYDYNEKKRGQEYSLLYLYFQKSM